MYFKCYDCGYYFYDDDEGVEECPDCGGSHLRKVEEYDPMEEAINAALDELR